MVRELILSFGETEASVESKSQREIIVDLTYQSNWDNRYVSYMSNCCDREKKKHKTPSQGRKYVFGLITSSYSSSLRGNLNNRSRR